MAIGYQGDIAEDGALYWTFNTTTTAGAPITLAGTPSLQCHKDNNTTQTTAGLTLTVDFDGITGLHLVTVDSSADAFYATGSDYDVSLAAGTVDGQSVVGTSVSTFSIENRFAEVDVTKIGGDAQSATDLKDFADAGYDPATNKVQGVLLTDTVTTLTNKTGFSLAADQSGVTIGTVSAVTAISANGISASSIAANAITNAKIADNLITAAKIATDAITADKIAANAITSSEIAVNAITAAKIASGAITGAKFDGSTAYPLVAADTITRTDDTIDSVTRNQADEDNHVFARGPITGASKAGGTLPYKKGDATAAWTATIDSDGNRSY